MSVEQMLFEQMTVWPNQQPFWLLLRDLFPFSWKIRLKVKIWYRQRASQKMVRNCFNVLQERFRPSSKNVTKWLKSATYCTHVFVLCIITYLYYVSVLSICITYLYYLYVLCICFIYLEYVSVLPICITYLYYLFVLRICITYLYLCW